MINLTPAFKQKLFNDERDYLEYADITLENNTVLHLTNANFWQNGFSIEDSIGEDNTFSALGAAVVNSCTLVINNIYDDFTEYDFTNAKVVVSVGMELPNPQDTSTTYIERAWKGTFMVDEATYNGSIITLKCLDDMAQFDRPYSESTLIYPKTLAAIVKDACAVCLGSVDMLGTQHFPHYDFEIQERPQDEKTTFREVISWCATIAGCYARFAYDGSIHDSKLELKWFNTQVFEDRAEGTDGGEFDTNSTTRYTTGDTLDGGTFNPWNTGGVADAGTFLDERPFHHISSLYNHNISVDDVVITGVGVTIEVEKEEEEEEQANQSAPQQSPYLISETDNEKTYRNGTEGYVIGITQNEFFTEDNVDEILTWLGTQLIGLTFRKASVTHPSDPSIEAGDIAFVYDRKGNEYPILVTRTVFNGFGMQTTVCGAETPNRNSATRYSETTKSYVELRKKVKERAEDTFAKAMAALQEGLDNANGLYITEVPQTGGGVTTFLHNKPNPTAAQGIFEFPSDSNIVIMISDVGIVATNEGDTGGQNIGDRNWYGLQVDGTLIATILNTIGVNADWINAGSVSANYIQGGELTLGGNGNGNGILKVYDANNKLVGQWDNTAIDLIGATTWTTNTKRGARFKNGSWEFYNINTQTDVVEVIGYIQPIANYKLRIGQELTNGSYGGVSLYARQQLSNGGYSISEMTIGVDSGGTGYVSLPTNVDARTSHFAIGNYKGLSGNIGSSIYLGYFGQTYPSQSTWNGGIRIPVSGSTRPSGVYIEQCSLYVQGNGYKSKVVETEDYGNRVLFCYEMATPIFGDIGSAKLDDKGICFVDIDDIFQETTELGIEYQVFLQKEGQGDLWVEEKAQSYFVVKGTPNLRFSWELKARQKTLAVDRLENMNDAEAFAENTSKLSTQDEIEEYYDSLLEELVKEQEEILYETA